MSKKPDYMTVDEVVKHTGLSKATIYRQGSSGKIEKRRNKDNTVSYKRTHIEKVFGKASTTKVSPKKAVKKKRNTRTPKLPMVGIAMYGPLHTTKPKYADLLALSNEEIKDAARPFEVRRAEKDMDKFIIDLEQQVVELKQKIHDGKAQAPILVDRILYDIDELDLKERALEQSMALQKELF